MLRPLGILVTEIGVKGGDTSASMATKIKYSINRWYQKLWNDYLWNETLMLDEAVSVAGGADTLILPRDMAMIIAVTERSLDLVAKASSPYVFQARYISDRAIQSSPIGYIKAGYSPLYSQPSAAGIIKIVSSSASDTQTVRIWGENANGIPVQDQLTLTGTSSVSGTVTFAAGSITEVSKSGLTEGIITISDALDAVLDRIPAREYSNRYDIVRLQSLADAAYTFYVTGKKRFKPLEYDEDIPIFDCCDALVYFATAEILQIRGEYSKAMVEKNSGDQLISSLITEKEIFEDSSKEDTMPHLITNEFDRPVLSL